MMRKIVTSSIFRKDVERAKKRHLNIQLLKEVINKLANDEKLDPVYRDYALKGKFKGMRECHIKPDWLLIYSIEGNELELFLFRTGTHSDFFI